jgi:hypothetical protein
MLCISGAALAQVNESSPKKDVASKTPLKVEAAEQKKNLPADKMIQSATINLQSTVVGNQEQPKVLYILPWQSPSPTDVDFETLDNEYKAVFGHVEREELLREIESSNDIK